MRAALGPVGPPIPVQEAPPKYLRDDLGLRRHQEMGECCGCPLTPAGVETLSVQAI